MNLKNPADAASQSRSLLTMTIASDEEVEAEEDSESEGDQSTLSMKKGAGKKRKRQGKGSSVTGGEQRDNASAPLDPTFHFDLGGTLGMHEDEAMRGWDFKSKLCLT